MNFPTLSPCLYINSSTHPSPSLKFHTPTEPRNTHKAHTRQKMESQSKSSMNRLAVRSDVKVVDHPAKAVRCPDLLLRTLALVLTLVAAIIVGVDKESKTVPVIISDSLTLHVHATAKWHYMSAFVYFLVSNTIACSYAAASLVYITVAGFACSAKAALAIHVLDTVMMGLLLSASGASAAIGMIAQHGNSHVQWSKVCYVFGSYCHQMAAALVLCLVGSFAFLLLTVLKVRDLHKKAMMQR